MMALPCSATTGGSRLHSRWFLRGSGRTPGRLRLEPLEDRCLLSGLSSLVAPPLPVPLFQQSAAPASETIRWSLPASTGNPAQLSGEQATLQFVAPVSGTAVVQVTPPGSRSTGTILVFGNQGLLGLSTNGQSTFSITQGETVSLQLAGFGPGSSRAALSIIAIPEGTESTLLVQALSRETTVPALAGPLGLPPSPLPSTISSEVAAPLRLIRFPVLSGLHAPPLPVEQVAEVNSGEFTPILPGPMDLLPDETPVEPPLPSFPIMPLPGPSNESAGPRRSSRFATDGIDAVFASQPLLDLSSIALQDLPLLDNEDLTPESNLPARPGTSEALSDRLPIRAEDTAAQAGLVLTLVLLQDRFRSRSDEKRFNSTGFRFLGTGVPRTPPGRGRG